MVKKMKGKIKIKQKSATDYRSKYAFRNFFSIIMAIICTSLFFCVWQEFVVDNNQTGHLTGLGNYGMSVGLYFVLYFLFMRWLGANRIGVERIANLLAAQVITIFMVAFCEVFLSMAITGQFRFAWAFIWRYFLLAIAQSVITCFLLYFVIGLYRKTFPPIKVLEIYGERENHLSKKITARPDKYKICKSIYIDDVDLYQQIQLAEAVLINDVPSAKKNKILKYCYKIDKRVYFTPKISDIITRSSDDLNLFDTPLLLCKNQGLRKAQEVTKRIEDLVLSSIALIVMSPFMLITAIAIKLEDGGPVFYKQERCTIGNKRFWILKFRSMCVDAEKDGKPHPAGENDDRITKVGRIIRPIRFDELPQLINIFRGEMSIVGPRPERVEHVLKYTDDIPEFELRSKVKGGLTGYAQVYGKYNTSALDKLKMDLMYITNYSIVLDIQIVFETIKILVQKESTEGFSEEARERIIKLSKST